MGERIEAGLQLMRTHAVDGRAILIATIEDFFKGLFDEEKPPVLGQLAFWTTKDGSQWLDGRARDLARHEEPLHHWAGGDEWSG